MHNRNKRQYTPKKKNDYKKSRKKVYDEDELWDRKMKNKKSRFKDELCMD